MSAKDCCIKVKNCSGLTSGIASGQVGLIEGLQAELPASLERKIAKFWDDTVQNAKALQTELRSLEK